MLLNIILLIIVIITGMILSYYNGFVKKGNRVKERESQIDVLLNQRFDLIPNIVNCVKGYAKHEKTTLENVTKLRSDYQNNGFSTKETEKIDNQINNLMAIAESYTDLKANADFLNLQRNLNEIENKLSYARTSYNNAVTSFNNAVESVPSNIIAKIFNFEKKDLFQIESEKRENIKVNL